MTCIYIPVLIQVIIFIAVIATLGVAMLMYLDGYWSQSRVAIRKDEKWKRDNPFSALDRKYLGYGRYKKIDK